jgi:hypothetical protein
LLTFIRDGGRGKTSLLTLFKDEGRGRLRPMQIIHGIQTERANIQSQGIEWTGSLGMALILVENQML